MLLQEDHFSLRHLRGSHLLQTLLEEVLQGVPLHQLILLELHQVGHPLVSRVQWTRFNNRVVLVNPLHSLNPLLFLVKALHQYLEVRLEWISNNNNLNNNKHLCLLNQLLLHLDHQPPSVVLFQADSLSLRLAKVFNRHQDSIRLPLFLVPLLLAELLPLVILWLNRILCQDKLFSLHLHHLCFRGHLRLLPSDKRLRLKVLFKEVVSLVKRLEDKVLLSWLKDCHNNNNRHNNHLPHLYFQPRLKHCLEIQVLHRHHLYLEDNRL